MCADRKLVWMWSSSSSSFRWTQTPQGFACLGQHDAPSSFQQVTTQHAPCCQLSSAEDLDIKPCCDVSSLLLVAPLWGRLRMTFSPAEALHLWHRNISDKSRKTRGNVSNPQHSELCRKVTARLIGINQLAAPVEWWSHHLKTNGTDPKTEVETAPRRTLVFPAPPQKKEQQPWFLRSRTKSQTWRQESELIKNRRRKAALDRFFFILQKTTRIKEAATALLHYSFSFFFSCSHRFELQNKSFCWESLLRREESKIHLRDFQEQQKRRRSRETRKTSNWNQHLQKVPTSKVIISAYGLTCSAVVSDSFKQK